MINAVKHNRMCGIPLKYGADVTSGTMPNAIKMMETDFAI